MSEGIGKTFLLMRYFHQGWLLRRYFDDGQFVQPFSAEDRLRAGELLYADYLAWQKGMPLIRCYEAVKVDGGKGRVSEGVSYHFQAERFRRALRLIPAVCLPVVYKIVLEEAEIKLPHGLSARERLYFNDEVKGLLCRGLDKIIPFYDRAVMGRANPLKTCRVCENK